MTSESTTIKRIERVVKDLLFTNLFIGAVAASMSWESISYSNQQVPLFFYLFLFFITTLVYTAYSLLDKKGASFPFGSERSNWNQTHRSQLILISLFCVWGLVNSSAQIFTYLFWFLPAGIGGVAYFILVAGKKSASIFPGNSKTILLSAVWFYTTYVIPHGIIGDLTNGYVLLLGLIAWMPIMVICIFFDLRDDDISLSKDPARYTKNLLGFCIFFSAGSLFFLEGTPECQFVTGKIWVLIFLRITLRHSLQTQSPIWYYGVLDGLMGFPFVRLITLLS